MTDDELIVAVIGLPTQAQDYLVCALVELAPEVLTEALTRTQRWLDDGGSWEIEVLEEARRIVDAPRRARWRRRP